MVEIQIIKWILLKENMMKENKEDQTVGVHMFMEQREGSGANIEHCLCACHCARYTGVVGKMNSPEPIPEAHTVCTNIKG